MKSVVLLLLLDLRVGHSSLVVRLVDLRVADVGCSAHDGIDLVDGGWWMSDGGWVMFWK